MKGILEYVRQKSPMSALPDKKLDYFTVVSILPEAVFAATEFWIKQGIGLEFN